MTNDRLSQILESLGGERRIDYSLERFQSALKFTGNPEKSVYSLVIAGTNGKGTTTLLVSSALREAGFRVGTYLSPHLQHPRERFLSNLIPVGERELIELAEEYLPLAQEFRLTYFEFLTLLCFIWAKRARFDFLVLEVGLGGRLDATNVTTPLASAITTIDWDHQAYLGNSLEAILDEKMGILRTESLVFTGLRAPNLVMRLEQRCQDLDAIAYYASQIRTAVERIDWTGQTISLNDYPFQLTNPSTGTMENAAVAFLLMRIVFPRIPVSTLQSGFARVITPARMEIVQESPRVVLSGDHNPAGVRCLANTLERLGARKEKTRVVCAFSPDKPYREMFTNLRSLAQRCELTQVSRLRNKMPPDYFNMAEDKFEPDAKTAIQRAMAEAKPDETIIITGSLYLAGEVRSLWHSEVNFLRTPGPLG